MVSDYAVTSYPKLAVGTRRVRVMHDQLTLFLIADIPFLIHRGLRERRQHNVGGRPDLRHLQHRRIRVGVERELSQRRVLPARHHVIDRPCHQGSPWLPVIDLHWHRLVRLLANRQIGRTSRRRPVKRAASQ